MKKPRIILLAAVASAFVAVADNAQPNAQTTQVQVSVTQTPADPVQVQPQVRTAVSSYARTSSIPKRVILAVEKFDDTDGSNADDAAQLRERVLHRVVGTRKFEVVERADLKKVVSEINNGVAGLTDSNTAPKEGLLKAAGYVVYGKLLFCAADSARAEMVGLKTSRNKFSCELQLKVSQVETGRILASKVVVGCADRSRMNVSEVKTDSAASEDPLRRDAIEEAAMLAVDEIRALLYPAKVVRVDSRYATVNMTQEEVRVGDVFDVFEDEGEMYDPDTGVSLGSEGAYIGRMKVEITGPRTSRLASMGELRMNSVRPGCLIQRVGREALKATDRPKPGPFDGL